VQLTDKDFGLAALLLRNVGQLLCPDQDSTGRTMSDPMRTHPATTGHSASGERGRSVSPRCRLRRTIRRARALSLPGLWCVAPLEKSGSCVTSTADMWPPRRCRCRSCPGRRHAA
jgi:hypothetical protein